MTIQQLASRYSKHFTRIDMENISVAVCNNNAPLEVIELNIFHGGYKDVYRCKFLLEVLEAIASSDVTGSVQLPVSTNQDDLSRWLNCDVNSRMFFVDYFLEENRKTSTGEFTLLQMLSGGQLMEKVNILRSVEAILASKLIASSC